MTAGDVVEILELAAAAGVGIWLEGGWAVDAVLGEQTRPHRDVDVLIDAADAPTLLALLTARSYERTHHPSDSDWNFEYQDPAGRVVDVHLLYLDETRTGGRMGDSPAAPVLPTGSLAGWGRIGGRRVACVAPEWQVAFHTGYPPDADDWADVRRLCARFDLPVPPEYDAFRFPSDALPAIAGERALLSSAVRRNSEEVGRLLHDDFVEFGSSGRIWTRTEVIRALARELERPTFGPLDLHCSRLDQDSVLLTYRTVRAGRATLRSSIWLRDADGRWRLRFHQGTPAGDGVVSAPSG
jgi:lincosamide nucleotidyltransferase A/C/D/E